MPTPSLFAEVAVPVSIDRIFTYAVPVELHGAIVPGVRAVVPFGKKTILGIVVGTSPVSPIASPKSLVNILDPTPVVSKELLDLTKWMADYYSAPWGEVLKVALVQGTVRAIKRVVSSKLSDDDLARTLTEFPLASRQTAILRLLMRNRTIPLQKIQKQVGTKRIYSVLNDLVQRGVVSIGEESLKRSPSSKVEQIVEITEIARRRWQEWMDAAQQATNPHRLAKQAAIVKTLLGIADRSSISTKQLLKRSGASLSSIRTLAEKNVLTLSQREIPRARSIDHDDSLVGSQQITLNDFQRHARDAIVAAADRNAFHTFLLYGITGSGKTQVYIETIRAVLAQGKTAIVLVPEISLTPQIVRRFALHFGDRVAVMHSRMSAGERYEAWQQAHIGKCSVVIGPRSTIFAPVKNLGLIVIDEEQEPSYKQFDQTPRYHARDVAIMRARNVGGVVVLGSATPSLESYANALSGKYTLLELPERTDNARLPDITIVDMTEERRKKLQTYREERRLAFLSHPDRAQREKHRFEIHSVSDLLREKIDDRLRKKEGIILLQNRRGFAPLVECPDCGHVETCGDCNISLTYHATNHHLRCHYCGRVKVPSETCPVCHSTDVQYRGFGTQRVEDELIKLFPGVSPVRMDLDTTTSRGAHDRILKRFAKGEVDILLGTQMVAKGLDFSRVTLVGVVSADTQMLLPDFRASERTFQLLTQVAGRAGRSAQVRGEVVIQTYLPRHYSLRYVSTHDFRGFYHEELQYRRELNYPPFARLILVELRGPHEAEVLQHAGAVGKLLRKQRTGIIVLGPAPAAIPKLKGLFRAHIVLKSPKADDPSGQRAHAVLHHAIETYRTLPLKQKNSVKLIVDVDPIGMM